MQVTSCSVKDTIYIGKRLAKNLQKGDIICLFGELGSGKTVLAKGIACGLGVSGDKVASPSFVLIHEYAHPRLPLYHFDLYRLRKPQDILALGYEEYLYGAGASVIEWADRLGYLLPQEYLKIELSVKAGTQRQLNFKAFGKRYEELLVRAYEPRPSKGQG